MASQCPGGASSAGYTNPLPTPPHPPPTPQFGAREGPLQLWEPDYQGTITGFINDYIDGRDLYNVPSGGGLAFAINIDPSMFDVLSTRSKLEGEKTGEGGGEGEKWPRWGL